MGRYAGKRHAMVFGATDKTSPRRESFPASAPPGPRCPGPCRPSPRCLPGCHSTGDDGPEPCQRSPVHTEIALALARLGDSTDRLLATAGALDDAQAAAPSRLPGWTRGHILTHLARNADGFRNLLIWARTGTETPMYPSEESRDRDIEAGARRPAAGTHGGRAGKRSRVRHGCGGTPGGRLGCSGGQARGHVPGPGDPAAEAVRAGDPSRGPGRGVRAGRLAR